MPRQRSPGNGADREMMGRRWGAAAVVEEPVDAVDEPRSTVLGVAGVAAVEDPAARDGDEAA